MARVLVVDDDRAIRIAVRKYLSDADHEVTAAEDAEEAERLFEEHDFDVVVADIILPGASGLDLLKRIRAASPDAQVILMTCHPSTASATDALRSGAFDYLFKPVPREAVVRAVSNAANVKALRDEQRRLEAEKERYRQSLEEVLADRTHALRETEERYRRLVQHSPDGIAVYCHGRLVFANETMASLLAEDLASLRNTTAVSFVRADLREETQALFTKVATGKAATTRFETVLVRRGGAEVYVDGVALPFVHNDTQAVQAVLRDVTEEKLLEERLMHSQKMESLGQLAGGIAHDFNNLLTGIVSYAGFALEHAEEATPVHSDLVQLHRITGRAVRLVGQLLAFSRRQTLEPIVLNVNDLIGDIIQMFERIVGESIRLEFRPGEDLGNVRADPGQMENVLLNMVLNARDVMPNGGRLVIVTGNVEWDAMSARLHEFGRPGEYVTITMADTGNGMDRETQRRVFEPFFTTKGQGKGTGLGLAMAYGTVKQHGGEIWVYSEPKVGTTFRIYLPRVCDETEPRTRQDQDRPIPKASETILVVMDDDDVRGAIQRLLADGYEVLVTPSPDEATKLLAEHGDRVDLLVTDAVMPGCNGVELHERLRDVRPSVPVLYMLGHTDTEVAQQCLTELGGSFLRKPFALDVLAAKVKELLGCSEANRSETIL